MYPAFLPSFSFFQRELQFRPLSYSSWGPTTFEFLPLLPNPLSIPQLPMPLTCLLHEIKLWIKNPESPVLRSYNVPQNDWNDNQSGSQALHKGDLIKKISCDFQIEDWTRSHNTSFMLIWTWLPHKSNRQKSHCFRLILILFSLKLIWLMGISKSRMV